MDEQRYRKAEQRMWQSKGAETTERFLQLRAPGVSVRVQELGEGSPLLFVHGGNIAGSSWATLAARLTNYRCIVVDRPGCGLSDPLPTMLDAANLQSFGDAFVASLLDALELESADIMATSFGSYLALRGAAAHPRRFRRLVLFGWPFGESSSLPAFMRLTSVPGVARLMNLIPANDRAVRMMFRSIGHGPSLKAGLLTPEDIGWCRALFRDTDTMRNELTPVRAWISPRHGIKEELVLGDGLLSSVTSQVLMLWGENDPFGGPEVARRFVQRLPNAELDLIPGAGHAPWLDALDRCVAATDDFLKR